MGVICNVHIVNTGAAAYILKWRAWDGRGVWRGCNGGGTSSHILTHISPNYDNYTYFRNRKRRKKPHWTTQLIY